MEIVPHKTASGKWLINCGYSSGALYRISREVPGLLRTSSKTYEGYSDSIELVVEKLRQLNLRFDASQWGKFGGPPHEPRPPIAPVANQAAARDYQRVGINFLVSHGREGALLADEMGLGKTFQILTAARCLNSRMVVTCPSYVRGVWWNDITGGEIKKWWPDVAGSVFLPHGVKTVGEVPNGIRIVVIHPDILYAWVDAILRWEPRIFAMDEAHMFCSPESRQSRAASKLAAKCEIRWAMTGTPLTSRPKDLYGLVDLLSPGRFGNFFQYGLRHCNAHQVDIKLNEGGVKTVWDFNGKSNLEELNGRLNHFMLRRTTEEVGLQLPPKTRQTIWVETKARGCIAETNSRRALREALDRSADVKMRDVLSIVAEHAHEGSTVAVACWRRSAAEFILDGCRKEGLAGGLIHGGVNSRARGKTIHEASQAKGGYVLATTIDAAALGIDLTFCNIGIFAELTYEPHEILQWEARFHRPGQTKPVLIKFILAKGTSDELVAHAVIDKLDTFQAAIGKQSGGKLAESLTISTENALEEIGQMIAKMRNA